MSCSQCRPSSSFSNEGNFHIRTDHPVLLQSLEQYFVTNRIEVTFRQEVLTISFTSLSLLQSICEDMSEKFNSSAKGSFYCAISEDSVENKPYLSWISFPHFLKRIQHEDLLEVIQHQLFTTYSQPIMNLRTNEIYGYEFLLRPIKNGPSFNPFELFQMAQRSGLQALLDGKARIASIKSSALAVPKGMKRFINFLPSSIYDPKHCLATTFKAAAEAGVDPEDLVFEVVETEEIADIDHLKSILTAYQEQGMKVALDDLGAGHSTLSVLRELRPDYVKIDRKIISFCDENTAQQEMILQIVQTAKEIGSIVLAEGIERKEEAEFVFRCGVQLAQGYYFGKPVPTENVILTAK
ncbi:EAL domain-containing protein [Fictibacillus barbaricus]|uniref:EAL domain-containing protein (Putative c-di-GMP-specific phosphodiesterase class I) n=1 Tax=Fictibacillus barbaricus TaxID=182136 RepID=A0ABU1TXD0_9BACL|nr:EAL domain-containing protein [Fictibacillus barbaricus]MDR7071869.1 EAL domain-containing protein (putative c-di-GMP-specific phosphodiesterase class I) [Fictibacillus barbaricus]